MSEATLGRVGLQLGGYRSTDFWMWSLPHVEGLIARVEAVHGMSFPEAVIKCATGADMFFGVYVDHVLPVCCLCVSSSLMPSPWARALIFPRIYRGSRPSPMFGCGLHLRPR